MLGLVAMIVAFTFDPFNLLAIFLAARFAPKRVAAALVAAVACVGLHLFVVSMRSIGWQAHDTLFCVVGAVWAATLSALLWGFLKRRREAKASAQKVESPSR